MSCVTRVTKTLEESKGVAAARFDPKSSVWTVTVTEAFDAADVTRRIRAAGDEHGRQLERPNDPPWIAFWTSRREAPSKTK